MYCRRKVGNLRSDTTQGYTLRRPAKSFAMLCNDLDLRLVWRSQLYRNP